MSRGLVAVIALVGSVAACGGAQSLGKSSLADSCVGPRLAVAPTTVRAGGQAHAFGEWFAADCYDMGQPGTPPALRGLTVQVSQHGQTWTVASGVDAAGRHYAFHVLIQIPKGLHPGAAAIAVKGYGSPAKVQVVPK